MKIKVGINGLGRIGRMIIRSIVENDNKNIEINNLNEFKSTEDNFVFHAGTKKENGDIYAIGGRVLNFVSTSNNLKETRNNIFNLIKKLNWKNGFYRKDIGYKVID